ncbi:MAG: PIN domain-containing protein [Thermaerobacter sp.]|nr:PIN domain-containing protein [Thermaerobacter sp.]
MAAFLLDTTAVIDWLADHSGVGKWIEARLLEGGDVGIGPITLAEVIGGMEPAQRSAVRSILEKLTWVPISEDVAVKAGELFWDHERQGKRLPFPDLLQAASALLTGRTVATSNLRHFPDVDAVDPRRTNPA